MILFPDNLTKQQFLDKYWQKQPVLFRKALDNAEQLISKEQLFALSLEDNVESRLLLENGPEHPWQTFHGPQQSEQLESLSTSTHWTLLVQSVNLWLEKCQSLLNDFDFIPQWRLDDIMVSFATEQGSVGPHIDQYDVFLIQLTGSRRWTVAKAGVEIEEAVEIPQIKQVKPFEATIDETLYPGDMLYIPPNTAHHGVNLQDGMTLSVGFRSPALSEMLMLLAEQVMTDDNCSFYRDSPLTVTAHTTEISSAAMTKAANWVTDLEQFESLKRKSFGLLQTQPKQELLLDLPPYPLSDYLQSSFLLHRDPSARVAWYQATEGEVWLFINGECFERSSDELDWIKFISTEYYLSSEQLSDLVIKDKFIILLEIFVESGLFGIK
ncbi:MAG: 50S ribosomal protein L16 3-hydroxylase [Enterobacterales bacterium]|jgi:50S ribosomal protein L16 3-hydroxylase